MMAISCPTEEPARIAVATQNILREEAHLCDVIDPLGGSYYVEKLTNQMEDRSSRLWIRLNKQVGCIKLWVMVSFKK